jgi:hypothetical protein
MLIAILCFVIFSYFVGAKSIYSGKYQPSIYSRIIWFLLTLNSFASILALKNSNIVLVYGSLALIGNLVILLLSWQKSPRVFGRTELISTVLLGISLAIWIFTRLPILNLSIGLIAHFVGGLPTIRRAFNKPRSENIHFWLYFCIASILTVLVTNKGSLSDYLYPLYFALFDGLMVTLCLRGYLTKLNS